MSSVKLNSRKVEQLRSATRSFNKALYDNCDSLGFFRYHVYEGKDDDIRVDLLATDIDGNVKRVLLIYKDDSILFYPEVPDVVYDNKRTEAVKNGFKSMIVAIQSFGVPISQMFIEITDGIDRGVIVKDSKEEGSYIVFLMGAVDQSALYKLLDKGSDTIYRVWSSIYEKALSKPKK